MAKPLANGYPIGAVMLRDTIAPTMTAGRKGVFLVSKNDLILFFQGTHGTTFGGSPMACAVGHHVLSRLSSPSFATHISDVSKHLDSRLKLLPEWFPALLHGDVRGRGLIRALAFKDDKHPAQVMQLARERGVFVLTAGKDALRLVPPLTVSKEEVDIAMDVLEGSLASL